MSCGILVILNTGSIESTSVASYNLYKLFDKVPSNNELAVDLRNVLRKRLDELDIYQYLKFEYHELGPDSRIFQEHGWQSQDCEDSWLLMKEIQINEIVSISDIENFISHPIDDFFDYDKVKNTYPNWFHGENFTRQRVLLQMPDFVV